MSRTGLNLALLRARGHTSSGPEPGEQGGLTRRQLFRIAGAVAVAAKLMPTAKASAAAGPVAFTSGRGRVAFLLDGVERWIIDTRAFGGSPRLQVSQTEGSVQIELTGAAFPGTDLPADMVCVADLNSTAGLLEITFTLGQLKVRVPLRRWLAGETPASGRMSLSNQACTISDRGRLTLTGSARAQFFPDWAFRLDGSGIAHLTGVGREELISDSISIALLGDTDPSLLNNGATRRTLISMGRRDRTWDLETAALAPQGWRMVATDHPFDQLHIETSLSRKGEVRQAIAAEPGTEESRLALEATGGLHNTDGTPFRMPLSQVRYALSFDQAGSQTALIGRFGQEPVWLHADGCSLLLGDQPGSAALELVQRNGVFTRAICTPALLGMSAPMQNVITEPRFTGGTRLVSLANTEVPQNGDLSNDLPNIGPSPGQGEIPIVPIDLPPVPVDQPPIAFVPLNLTLSVLRPDDLLVLDYEFVNLQLQAGGDKSARLVRQVANRPAYVIVKFQPQSFGERAFYEAAIPGQGGDEIPTAPPIPVRMAGPSRLVFRLPSSMNEIPYTLEALLNWTQYDHALVPAALPPSLALPIRLTTSVLRRSFLDVEQECDCEPLTPAMIPPPRIQSPEEYHTAIEAPYRVFISPNKYAGWAHSVAPVTHDGRTELWHTRLGVRNKDGSVDELSAYLRTIRAIWSPDFKPTVATYPDASPFLMSLNQPWRNQIVRLSSDFTISKYTPRPVQVDRLMLSSLGAFMNVRGAWNKPAGFTVTEWRHRAVMGRDTYVRVVEMGYLFPFGHRAALITVTERKFQPTPSGAMAAYLRQRKFVVVRQPEKTFPAQGQAYQGRQMPMKSVTVTTLVTPPLDQPKLSEIWPGADEAAFWCRVGTKDFQFNIITVDGEGQRQEFTTPLAFIRDDVAFDATQMAKAAQNLANGDAARRQRDMKGQKLAYAPADKPGDTSFETASLTFAGEIPDAAVNLAADQPRFFPAMAEAQVRMAQVEQMTGSPAPARIKMAQAFLDSAFETAANKTGIFGELLDTVSAKFPANMSGGVATPNLDVSGISRALGPVGGPINDLVGGNFDPKKFFSDEAKILGGILLSDIIQALGLDGSNQHDPRVPQLTSRVVYPEKNGKEDKDAVPLGVETKLYWKPDVKNDPLNIFVTTADTSLEVKAKLFATFDGKPPTYEITGELKSFKVDLIAPISSFILLTFKHITFTAKSGSKPDVSPKIDKVEFKGALQFIQTLQEFLHSGGGGGSPFSLDIQPSGVTAGLAVAIPNVTVGVFSLTNMKLSVGLTLPFTGDPVRLRFAFCSKEDPFTLTVSLFGGGGFFAISLGLDGVETLEASFEFGGNFSLDIGVASGGVHIMAGIYYKMDHDDAQLTGYLRLGGSLSVLGIITVSAEFNMSLTYDVPKDKVWGQATLTVKIEILFFSMSVDLHVERKFKGSAGDPTFADLMDRSDWETYAEAFA